MAYYHRYGGKVNHETPMEEGKTYCGKDTVLMERMQYHDDGGRPICFGCCKKKEIKAHADRRG